MARPMELETFMVFFGMLTQLLAGREAFEHRYATVIAMVDMLVEYGGKVPPSDQVGTSHMRRPQIRQAHIFIRCTVMSDTSVFQRCSRIADGIVLHRFATAF